MTVYRVKFEAVSLIVTDGEAEVALEVLKLLKDGVVKVVVEASSS